MTISFLRYESAFKTASKELLDAVNSARRNGRVAADGLMVFLLRQERRWSSSEAVLSGAEGLANYLNRLDGKPSLGRCQQALAHVFAGCQYQDLIGYWNSDIARLLADLILPPPDTIEDGIEVIHPYPLELQRVPLLAPLKSHWEANNVSTSQRAFLPPMPPPEIFGLKRFGPHEIFRSWPLGKKGELSNARMTIVLKDGAGKYIGAVHWNWWGYRLAGSDYTIYAKDGDAWLYVTMDIRPKKPLPDRGPKVEWISEEEFIRHMEFLVPEDSADEEGGQ
ncbi:hypothetical protein [Magnetospirillum sulfuroxidans]|uniref:Uncharacterized protein n=1 Tax=Magnetospirillum sulfuroxidans TaxID=611300 RepID=A0ABS5ICF6_9PROT|nr:hypothetical protein [Magnetospirillum sulfuroxidans]MBR9972110.1 hypothetical protein [Magnetospirillum sulfuroxidans]